MSEADLPYWRRTATPWQATDGRTFSLIDEPYAVTARTDHGELVGYITWGPRGIIGNVSVREQFQRLGVATELLRRARLIEPGLEHSTRLSDSARAWIASLPPST